jgi:hypothetical protein
LYGWRRPRLGTWFASSLPCRRRQDRHRRPDEDARELPGSKTLPSARRKLLELYYSDWLSAELFAEGEARLSSQIEAVRREREEQEAKRARLSDVAAKFEEVARILREMDVDRLTGRGHRRRAPRHRGGAVGVRCDIPRPSGGHGERRPTAERHAQGGRPSGGVAVSWCRRGDTNHSYSPRPDG